MAGGSGKAVATWRPALAVKQLIKQANDAWPKRSKASDGTIGDAAHASRASDHNPWVTDGAVGVVTACDITNDPAAGCSAERITAALVASRDARIKYIIWNKRICNAESWLWKPYGGSNPHTHHFHLSVSSEKTLYDNVGNWTISEEVKFQPPGVCVGSTGLWHWAPFPLSTNPFHFDPLDLWRWQVRPERD